MTGGNGLIRRLVPVLPCVGNAVVPLRVRQGLIRLAGGNDRLHGLQGVLRLVRLLGLDGGGGLRPVLRRVWSLLIPGAGRQTQEHDQSQQQR